MQIQKRSLLRDERGLSTVEYTVLLVLIVACAVGLWSKFGGNVASRLSESNSKFEDKVVVEDHQ
jgi:Flp pilus assembly pilin Flp